jgi:serine/threonine-protein kinase/endoribonuclease IRE1
MLRRPPGHVAQQRKYLLAFAAILLPWLHVADAQQQQRGHAQQQQQHHHQIGSRRLADYGDKGDPVVPGLTGSDVPEATEIRRKNTATSSRGVVGDDKQAKNPHSSYETYLLPEDASAVDTYALDSSVRAPSPPRHRAGPASGAGLSSPQTARSLRDWEVEDYVLLATVDGNLHATDRATGKQRWELGVEQPMVQTTHYRSNKSVVDEDYNVVDDYLWVVEPNRDGALYLWVPHRPGAGLVKMGYTMKQMVEELSPHNDKDQDIVYTGDKKTTLVTLDAATGRVLKWFGSGGTQVNEAERCLRPNALADMDSEECSNSGTITLGRTEYTVGIQRGDGQAIASLKYSEWGPNTFDNDLLQQHQASIDHRYITSQHDGQVYFFDQNKDQPVFAQQFSSPVARVFEVARPWVGGAAPDVDPELIVLPQPPPPSQDDQIDRMRSRSIFINQTETGSWYAMSGRSYPMIVKAPAAKANSPEWWEGQQARDYLDASQLSKALVGTHVLEKQTGSKQAPLLTIDDGTQVADWDDGDDNGSLQLSTPIMDHLQPSAIFNEAKKLPEMAAVKVVDLISNPVLILMFVFSLFYYQQDLRRWYKRKRSKGEIREAPFEGRTEQKQTSPEPIPAPDSSAGDVLAQEKIEPTSQTDPLADSIVTADIAVEKEKEKQEGPSSVTFAEPLEVRERSESISGDRDDGLPNETPKKKKAHRGRRGGTKHKKAKDKVESSPSLEDDAAAASVDEVIKKAKALGEEPKLEPDILTVTNDVEEVSGPVLKMGSLEVNTDQQLGTGSNGTVVFAGKWDGRDVAIKRMLIQFNEIASQETKLLRESDDHPNGTCCCCMVYAT